ncbi:MAG TPA: dihydrofolate reductase [Flavisolibacter sp.]|nr:dihydrofolate reductase [Flavisolibacter sp.]
MTGKIITENSNLSSPTGGQGAVLSLLVAADENNVIGKDNQLPWHLPNDLRYFKNQTWGMPILMGRKTFESIGKPLPGRKSIVITRNENWMHDGVDVVHSIDEAIEKAKNYGVKEIFVIGGAEIFNSSFQRANRIYLTRIHYIFNGDVYFPKVTDEDWSLVQEHYCSEDSKNMYAHTFQVWERK